MIRLNGVTLAYPQSAEPAVDDVSFQITGGAMVGIVGPNGSGKSTLGRLIKGLLLPTHGSVLIDDLDTRRAGLEVRRRVGLLFQNPNSQIVSAIVEQEVAFGPENMGLPPSEIRRRVDAALDLVGLAHHASAECHSLSMADKQRVALAAVLALEPSYLVLDEPTEWIEPRQRWELLERVVALRRQASLTIILITHRMDEALLCDRLLGLLDGRLVAEGTPPSVLGDAGTRDRLSLDLPETFILGEELRSAGVTVPVGSIDGMAETLCPS